jgi:hypothetical protein
MINDPVFGKMKYDWEWEKEEGISMFGKTYNLNVIAQSKSDEDTAISEVQQKAYKFFKENFSSLEESALNILLNYCQNELEIPDCSQKVFFENSLPISLFFAITGEWGILFDSKFDEENGIALMFSNGKFLAGPQDILI